MSGQGTCNPSLRSSRYTPARAPTTHDSRARSLPAMQPERADRRVQTGYTRVYKRLQYAEYAGYVNSPTARLASLSPIRRRETHLARSSTRHWLFARRSFVTAAPAESRRRKRIRACAQTRPRTTETHHRRSSTNSKNFYAVNYFFLITNFNYYCYFDNNRQLLLLFDKNWLLVFFVYMGLFASDILGFEGGSQCTVQ